MAFGDLIQNSSTANTGAITISADYTATPIEDNLLVAVHMTGATAATPT